MPRIIAGVLLFSLCCPLAAQSVPGQGTWETTLQPRDIDHDGTIDAYYDTALDITWSAAPRLPGSVDSPFLWSYALGKRVAPEWIAYLNAHHYLGATEWRLPRFRDAETPGCTRGIDCGQYHDPDLSEVAHMYAVTLGNLPYCGQPNGTCPQAGGGLTNRGPFPTLSGERSDDDQYRPAVRYWIEDPGLPPGEFWYFDIERGLQKDSGCCSDAWLQGWAWPVLDGDIAERAPSTPGPEPEPGDYAGIHCPGDVDHNGSPEVVAVSTGGRVIVRSLDGPDAWRFALTDALGLVDTQLAPDTDGNGSPELVALGTAVAEWRDLASGEKLAIIDFWDTVPSIDLELVEDTDGNGVPEVARQIVARWGEIQVRDGRTGDLIQYTVSRDSSAIDLVTASSNARPDIRLLGTLNAFVPNLELGKLFAAEYDGSNPLFGPRTRAFGSNTQPLQAEAIPDADGDGWPQFAVLKQRADNGRDSVTLLDLRVEEDFLRFDDAAIQIGLGEQFTSQKLLVAPDLNANGASEVVVYEYETTGSRHRALINDGRTGARIGIVHFSEQLVGIDAAICPDINNNGAAEIALLGIRPADGGVRVLLKDLSTDELLGAASLPRLQ